jgi:hypothetical protein
MNRSQLPEHIREKCPEGLTDEQVEAWLLGYIASTGAQGVIATNPIGAKAETPELPVVEEPEAEESGRLPIEPVKPSSATQVSAVRDTKVSHWGSTAGFIVSLFLLVSFSGQISKFAEGEASSLSPFWTLKSAVIVFLGCSAYRCMKVRILLGKGGGRLVYEVLAILSILSYLLFAYVSFPNLAYERPVKVGLLYAAWCLIAYFYGLLFFSSRGRSNSGGRDPWRGQLGDSSGKTNSQMGVADGKWRCPECNQINPNSMTECETAICKIRTDRARK